MALAWTLALNPLRRSAPNVLRSAQTLQRRNIYAAAPRFHRPPRRPKPTAMKVAVVGCAHGELDAMYAAVREIERAQSTSVELIICAGDFQAVRNHSDLACMACPDKFRHMRTFWKYYAGQSVASVPTLFIGGNHEASNHLQEIPLGGLVAPNMYFLGNAGVINYRGLRIGGISGVYTPHNYEKPRFERPPYPKSQVKSVYHTRKEDVHRLLRIARPLDVFISHDWPRGIWHHGDCEALLAAKPFLKSEISSNTFGNPGTAAILETLQPRYWFAAHIHVKFPALVTHAESGRETRFLALDKILPKRDFIQLLDIPVPSDASVSGRNEGDEQLYGSDEYRIELDPEWISILQTECEDESRASPVTEEEIAQTMQKLKARSFAEYVNPVSDFQQHGEVYSPKKKTGKTPTSLQLQPRSRQLLECLGYSVEDWEGSSLEQRASPVPERGIAEEVISR